MPKDRESRVLVGVRALGSAPSPHLCSSLRVCSGCHAVRGTRQPSRWGGAVGRGAGADVQRALGAAAPGGWELGAWWPCWPPSPLPHVGNCSQNSLWRGDGPGRAQQPRKRRSSDPERLQTRRALLGPGLAQPSALPQPGLSSGDWGHWPRGLYPPPLTPTPRF